MIDRYLTDGMQLANRFLRAGLGLVLVTASALKMHWHTHSPPQLQAGWLDNSPEIFVTSFGELCLGSLLLAGLWSQGIRLVSILVFILFMCIAVSETIRGSKNCGCFGGGVHVPPWGMAMFDSLVTILLLRCKANTYNGRDDLGFRKMRMAFVSATVTTGITTAVVWATHRPPVVVAQSSQIPMAADPFGTRGTLVLLEPERLAGKPFLLGSHIDIGSQLSKGQWIVLLVHHDCDECAGAVPKYQTAFVRNGATRLAIIEMPPYSTSGEPSPWVSSTGLFGKLDTTRDWFATTPLVLLVKNGMVQSAEDGQGAASPNLSWFSK